MFDDYRRLDIERSPYSLAKDMIADMSWDHFTQHSFLQYIRTTTSDIAVKSAKEDIQSPPTTINKRWPTFEDICSRVFAANVTNYDHVRMALAKEDSLDPMVEYFQGVIYA
jgi:hypothetical protein